MEKYNVLKEIVEDYIKHVDRINAKRVEIASRDLSLVMQEVKAFNLLQQNFLKIQESDGISQN